jgi:hypothetical protein
VRRPAGGSWPKRTVVSESNHPRFHASILDAGMFLSLTAAEACR